MTDTTEAVAVEKPKTEEAPSTEVQEQAPVEVLSSSAAKEAS